MCLNYIPRYFTVTLALILIFINIIYYFSIQDNLVTNQQEKVELIVTNIKGSIQENRDIEDSFNHYLAEDLRETSIAIQKELPADVNDVTTEQLAELEEQHSLKGVTLFVQKGDDIVSVKSSNEGEVGLSAKKLLSSDWHSMLQQLFANQNVKPIKGFGHALENFWAGPVARSKSNPNMVTKWGYYNDGSTNYILNLFVERNILDAYYETAGLEKKLQHIVEINPVVLNVSVINGEAILDGVTEKDIANKSQPKERLFVGGENRYPTPKDTEMALEALTRNEMLHQKAVSNDTAVLKSYFPSDFTTKGKVTDELMIVVTSDFDLVNAELMKRIVKNVIISTIIFLLGLTAILISVQAINRRERTLSNVQSLYKQHIDSLFETMREHRHDLNHHLYTISGLSSMKLYPELDNYVRNLVNLHDDTMDVVDVSLPALSGLIQAKKVEARDKGFEFEHHFENMDKLEMSLEKTTDIVKAAGNILDNAFHAVEESAVPNKRVSIYGKFNTDTLVISISNNGDMIPMGDLEKIFDSGMTTRSEIGGTGVGLYSSKKALERYKGTIEVSSDEQNTKFIIRMPISHKEIRINSEQTGS